MNRVELSHSLSGWPTGEIASPEVPTPPTELTFEQDVDGVHQERSFAVTTSDFSRRYERSANDESWVDAFEPLVDLDAPLDVELLALDALPNGFTPIQIGDIRPLPLNAPLGSYPGTGNCPVKPENVEVAQLLCDYLGLDLVIFEGPGLPFLHDSVPYDFMTYGKTPQQILNDTLLETNPRWWADGMTLYVDGRALTVGALPDMAGIENLSIENVRGAVIPEPLPPQDETDPEGGTFETFESGTFTWTESAGTGDDYTETTHTITKENGSVTQEREVRKAFVPSQTGPFWAEVYDSLTTREFHPLCSEAMITETQVVNAARTDITYWNVEQGIGSINEFNPILQPIEDWVPPMYETLRKTITQSWHAEGWLRTREEVTLEAGSYWAYATGAIFGEIAYKRSSRIEFNLPVGNGLWLQRVTEYIPVDAPVYVVPDGGLAATEATYPLAGINTFTRITDGPPPTVSCPTDPCRPTTTPEEDYERQLALREARLINDPDRVVYSLSLKHLALDWSLGDIVGGLLITSITRSVEADDVTCEVELWGALDES